MMDEYMDELKITKAGDKDAEGKQCDYVFVSYASKNREEVFADIVIPLHKEFGLRVYADKEFAYNNDIWVSQMKKNLSRSKVFVMFVSRAYVCSYACFLELLTAIKEKLPIVLVQIEKPETTDDETSLKISNATQMALNTIGNLFKARSDAKTISTTEAKAYSYYIEIENQINDGITESDLSRAFIDLIDSLNLNRAKYGDDLKTIISKIQTAAEKIDKDVSVCDKDHLNTAADASSDEGQVVPDTEDTSNEKKRTASVTGDITYSIYDKEYTENQSDMMIRVFARILQKHPDKVKDLPEQNGMNCASHINYFDSDIKYTDMPSYFRTGSYLPIAEGISIGTAYSLKDKLIKIAKLIEICDEDRSIFLSEDVQLPEIKVKKNVNSASSGVRSSSDEEEYILYGQKYCGNQTKMMIDALKLLMEKYFDRREQLAGLLSIKLKDRSELTNVSYFRTGESFEYEGVKYSIGTSFGRKDKLKQISKAIAICEEDYDNFIIEGLQPADNAKSRSHQKVNKNFLED